MYEIIANPADYNIEAIVEGMGYKPVAFPEDERQKWAREIGIFADRLSSLSDKAKYLHNIFTGEEAIVATPASLKTFKVQLFNINDALTTALVLAGKLESEIVKK
jgi:hypothetical protein